MINRYAMKVWYRDLLVWTRYWYQSILGMIGEPILYFVAIGYGLGSFIQGIDGVPYVEFLAPALVMSAIMNSASFETTYSSFTRMETQKTYYSIAVTPIHVEEIVAGEILWGATKSLLMGTIMLVAVAALGFVKTPLVLWALPVMVLNGFLFASLGMLMTSFAKDYDFFTYYFTLALEPMFLFSGTFFPLSNLPYWAQQVAWVFPLTHPVFIIRSLFQAEVSVSLVYSFAWMLFLSVVIFVWTVKRMVRRLVV